MLQPIQLPPSPRPLLSGEEAACCEGWGCSSSDWPGAGRGLVCSFTQAGRNCLSTLGGGELGEGSLAGLLPGCQLACPPPAPLLSCSLNVGCPWKSGLASRIGHGLAVAPLVQCFCIQPEQKRASGQALLPSISHLDIPSPGFSWLN